MGRIILAIPNNPAGRVALDHLRQNSETQFGAVFEGTLGGRLSKQAAQNDRPGLDEIFNHTYVSLTTPEDQEPTVLNSILQFHNNDKAKQGDAKGYVECGDLDRKLQRSLTVAVTPRIGAPLDLSTSPAKHNDYLNLLATSNAHSRGAKGKNVRVAIIDTGIHSSVTPNPVPIEEYHDIVNDIHHTGSAPIPHTTLIDVNGHGSAMAMIISEVAPDAVLSVIKICVDDPQLWDAMAGLGQALYVGAKVISFAFGFTSTANMCCVCGTSGKTQSDVFKLFLENIANLDPTQGLKIEPPIVVTPTGNDGSARGFLYPAGYECVLAVGSVDSTQTRSLFSNYGTVHSSYIMAPGGQENNTGTTTEYVGSGPSNTLFLGTSPAVAYATGMIALIRSDPRFTYTNRAAFLDKVFQYCSPKPTNISEQKEYGEGFISF
jgi:subtilisin family serine protease